MNGGGRRLRGMYSSFLFHLPPVFSSFVMFRCDTLTSLLPSADRLRCSHSSDVDWMSCMSSPRSVTTTDIPRDADGEVDIEGYTECDPPGSITACPCPGRGLSRSRGVSDNLHHSKKYSHAKFSPSRAVDPPDGWSHSETPCLQTMKRVKDKG